MNTEKKKKEKASSLLGVNREVHKLTHVVGEVNHILQAHPHAYIFKPRVTLFFS